MANESTDRKWHLAGLRSEAAAWREYELAQPPGGERARELWMQHAAGFVFFRRMRDAGLATLEDDAAPDVREAVEFAVDQTVYALMMLIDGVSGGLAGAGRRIDLEFGVRLTDRDGTTGEVDLFGAGDGMCVGFHQWKEGDFGDVPVVAEEVPPPPGPPTRQVGGG